MRCEHGLKQSHTQTTDGRRPFNGIRPTRSTSTGSTATRRPHECGGTDGETGQPVKGRRVSVCHLPAIWRKPELDFQIGRTRSRRSTGIRFRGVVNFERRYRDFRDHGLTRTTDRRSERIGSGHSVLNLRRRVVLCGDQHDHGTGSKIRRAEERMVRFGEVSSHRAKV